MGLRLFETSIQKTLAGFWEEEDGTASVDGIMWIIFFTGLLVFILDSSILYMNNTEVRRVTQDGSRLYVRGGFDDKANPEAALDLWVESNLSNLSANLNAVSSVNADNQVTTLVTYPADDTDLVSGLFDYFGGFDINVLVVNQKAVL